jgi:hypothetical protein
MHNCTCGCDRPHVSRGCRILGLWFASRLCRYRWAAANGRLGDLSRRERQEIESLEAEHAAHERFVPGLFAEAVLDEAAANAILRERKLQVFSEELERIRRWTPADDSPAAEVALRELVFSGQSEGDDE